MVSKEIRLKQAFDTLAPGMVLSFTCDVPNSVSAMYFDKSATPEQIRELKLLAENFDWEAPPPVEEIRKAEYEKQLGDVGNQFDAIFKGLLIIVPALIESKAISQEVAALLTPDPNAPVDTPAGWMGRVQKIKQDNPKEN